jgi:hypothetical protein
MQDAAAGELRAGAGLLDHDLDAVFLSKRPEHRVVPGAQRHSAGLMRA